MPETMSVEEKKRGMDLTRNSKAFILKEVILFYQGG